MPGHHCPIVLTCLEEGVNVSVEKPPGMTSNETEMMAEAARGSKGKAMVSFDRRYIPEVLAVRRLLQERGGAVHVGATCNKPSPAWARRLADVTPDPVISDAIHYADLLRWLAGPAEGKAALPIEVYSEVEDGERACDHRHNAAIRFDSGAIGSLISHYGVGSDIQRAEAYADDFSAYLDMFREPRVEWIGAGCTRVEMYAASYDEHGDARGQLMEGPLDLEAVGGPGFNETRHFVDCILNDRTPWSNLDDAVHTMRLCEAIRRGHKGAL
jgi:predicted dehydrogenase